MHVPICIYVVYICSVCLFVTIQQEILTEDESSTFTIVDKTTKPRNILFIVTIFHLINPCFILFALSKFLAIIIYILYIIYIFY